LSSVSRITFALLVVVAVSGTLLVLSPAGAAPGDLDPTFGSQGTVETQIATGGWITGLAIQLDGKIVAGGIAHPADFALARYEANGSLDRDFGSGGIVTGPPGNARGLALQPDGKILLAGNRVLSPRSFFTIARYRPDGSLDSTFGSDGVVTGPDGGADALALQADGKIVVVGTEPESYAFKLVRLNSDGTLDSSFGSNGSVQTLLGSVAEASAVIVQPDGRILAAGASAPGNPPPPPPPPPAPPPPPPPGPPPEPWRMTIARYNADGSLDTSFGSGGIVTTPVGYAARIEALALQPDGKIVTGGVAGDTAYGDRHPALARYGTDGALDSTFGSHGIVKTTIDPSGNSSGLALQQDGMIVIAGGRDSVARYRSNGTLDTTFGFNGVATSGFLSLAVTDAVAIQQNGRIVTGGYHYVDRETRFALSRYLSKSPTTIGAAPGIVGYGRPALIRGTLSLRQGGTNVQILKRGCYDVATRAAATIKTDSNGDWHVRVSPGSRTVFTAKVEGEKSSPLAVGVRPRLTLRKLSGGRLQARVFAARALVGDLVVLQQLAGGKWMDVRRFPLRRTVKLGAGIVSARTFRAGKVAGKRIRLSFPDYGNGACYAPAASRPITG
jgi:uncharacterized delta-60 repeat protein